MANDKPEGTKNTDTPTPKPEQAKQPGEITPQEAAAKLRKGCEATDSEYLTVQRKLVLKALELAK